MITMPTAVRGLALAGAIGALAACSGATSAPTSSLEQSALSSSSGGGTTAGSIRVRCEQRAGRSKISVDGSNLRPLNGTFSARVTSANGTVTAPSKQAIGDQAEFDFDSDAGDIALGATRLAPTFIAARNGPDVVGEILDAGGRVVASLGVECQFR